jgi:alpha-glucosidase
VVSRPSSHGCRCPVEHILRSVSVQQGDENSVLEHYRRFIAFRKQYPAFAKGEIEFRAYEAPLLGFERTFGNETILCLFNMSGETVTAERPIERLDVLEGHGFGSQLTEDKITLPAWSGFFARVE